jgi:hypothetical protein
MIRTAAVVELLEIYERVARPHLDKIFKPTTCTEQTRVLIEVLARFGVEAQPLGVKLCVTYEAGGFQFLSGLDPEERERARTTCRGYVERPNSEGNIVHGRHVVAVVERHVLVDSTLHQASAPEYGLTLKPMLIVLPFEKRIGGEGLTPCLDARFELDNGEKLDVRWIGTPDRGWVDDDGWEPSHLWPLIDFIEIAMLCAGAEKREPDIGQSKADSDN